MIRHIVLFKIKDEYKEEIPQLVQNFYGMKDTQDVQITPNINTEVPENADEIIEEPLGGIRYVSDSFAEGLKNRLIAKINELSNESEEELLNNRYEKFRRIGSGK